MSLFDFARAKLRELVGNIPPVFTQSLLLQGAVIVVAVAVLVVSCS